MLHFAVGIVTVAIGFFYLGRVALGLRQLTANSCATLIDSLNLIDFTEVCLVARSSPCRVLAPYITAEALVSQLGGIEGLRRLSANAEITLQIARYLKLTNPGANELVQQIRQDAAKVRRLSLFLVLMCKLGMWRLSSPLTVSSLAKIYISLTVTTSEMYVRVADDLLVILQEASNGGFRLQRASGALAATSL